MKKFLMFLMCAAAFTFAQTEEETEYQEEESTQVEQAEEAGEAEETSSVAQSEAVDYYAVDSLQVYNDLVEKFERRGNKIRRPGNPLIIAGSIALGVGLVMEIAGATDMYCDSYGENCVGDGTTLYALGYLTAVAGGLSLATGITLKIVGGTQLKRARMYRKKAEDYAARKDAAFLHVVPTIDPINGRFGTLALLDF
ncbi:MAG: hypothetical protein MJZ25_06840 [Fibrobacter sp.]|nr:hypothetical protein [Fibrobacter sp.]